MEKTRVTKPVEERKQEIIDTARAMFIELGFEKTQMADISKKMNVAAGTIYHYFKSKTELFYAVIDEMMDEKMQRKRQFLEESQGSAVDRLRLIFKSFDDEMHGNTSGNFTEDPAIIQYYLTKMSNSFLPILVSLIEQGNADGSWNCEYPREMTVFILQGMAGVMSVEQERTDTTNEKNKRVKAYLDFVFRVLGVAK